MNNNRIKKVADNIVNVNAVGESIDAVRLNANNIEAIRNTGRAIEQGNNEYYIFGGVSQYNDYLQTLHGGYADSTLTETISGGAADTVYRNLFADNLQDCVDNLEIIAGVGESISKVNTVANNITAVNAAADNLEAIQAAPTAASNAATSATAAAGSATAAAGSATAAAGSATTAVISAQEAADKADTINSQDFQIVKNNLPFIQTLSGNVAVMQLILAWLENDGFMTFGGFAGTDSFGWEIDGGDAATPANDNLDGGDAGTIRISNYADAMASATAAATSATAAAGSATEAANSATAAAQSATQSATSATAAATSATAAAGSATAAQGSATEAASLLVAIHGGGAQAA